jgi:putative transposase
MLIRKAYRYRLKTKPRHELKLRQAAGCSRFVWNKALALQKNRLDNKLSCLPYNELAGLLVEWKKDEDMSFLREILPSRSSRPL